MKKEVIVIFLVVLLVVMPFSSAQISSINVLDVNVSDNQIQVLVENKFDKDFNKITFIINSQYEVIKDEILSNFTAKFFYINYPGGIKLETVKVSVDGNEAKYDFTGNEDKFILNQAVSQTSELTQVESNSPVSYIYSAGRVAKIQDNNVIYFQSDNVGSTSLETDNIGNVNFKANYLPFGKELSFSSQGKEKYGFTSKEYDIESSLNYFNARYYNPSSGKFISNDPIFKPTEGGYQYVRNNPLTITDPSGKEWGSLATSFSSKYSGKFNENLKYLNGPVISGGVANENPGEIFETRSSHEDDPLNSVAKNPILGLLLPIPGLGLFSKAASKISIEQKLLDDAFKLLQETPGFQFIDEALKSKIKFGSIPKNEEGYGIAAKFTEGGKILLNDALYKGTPREYAVRDVAAAIVDVEGRNYFINNYPNHGSPFIKYIADKAGMINDKGVANLFYHLGAVRQQAEFYRLAGSTTRSGRNWRLYDAVFRGDDKKIAEMLRSTGHENIMYPEIK